MVYHSLCLSSLCPAQRSRELLHHLPVRVPYDHVGFAAELYPPQIPEIYLVFYRSWDAGIQFDCRREGAGIAWIVNCYSLNSLHNIMDSNLTGLMKKNKKVINK